MSTFEIILVFWGLLLLVLIFSSVRQIKRFKNRRDRVIPPTEKSEIIYQEMNASGRSLKTFYTKISGANKVLRIVLGHERLWISVKPPFSWIGNHFDLEHEVPYDQIEELDVVGTTLALSYRLPSGKITKLELRPESVERLCAYLKAKTSNK